MSRMSELLRKSADALDDGQIPLMNPFLSEHDVTFDECMDMAAFVAVGARLVAWAMENPKAAAGAFQGAKMQTLLDLMERSGWGQAARQ